MRKLALQYYQQDCNCSQCILNAAETKLKIALPAQFQNACSCVCTGFGIGGICSALVAGIMIFGIMFDEQTAKKMRICLLDKFSEKYHTVNCSTLLNNREDSFCENIVSDIADMVECIVHKYKN